MAVYSQGVRSDPYWTSHVLNGELVKTEEGFHFQAIETGEWRRVPPNVIFYAKVVIPFDPENVCGWRDVPHWIENVIPEAAYVSL